MINGLNAELCKYVNILPGKHNIQLFTLQSVQNAHTETMSVQNAHTETMSVQNNLVSAKAKFTFIRF